MVLSIPYVCHSSNFRASSDFERRHQIPIFLQATVASSIDTTLAWALKELPPGGMKANTGSQVFVPPDLHSTPLSTQHLPHQSFQSDSLHFHSFIIPGKYISFQIFFDASLLASSIMPGSAPANVPTQIFASDNVVKYSSYYGGPSISALCK